MENGQLNRASRTNSDACIDVRVVCGWCGRVLRDSNEAGVLTSHGLCPRCANVLEGGAESSSGGELAALEHRVNLLMCQIYQTKQLLVGVQQRLGTDGELSRRVMQALLSIREQERVVAKIQQDICSGV